MKSRRWFIIFFLCSVCLQGGAIALVQRCRRCCNGLNYHSKWTGQHSWLPRSTGDGSSLMIMGKRCSRNTNDPSRSESHTKISMGKVVHDDKATGRNPNHLVASFALATTIAAMLLFPITHTFTANAFDDTDYASETVTTTVKMIDNAAGNADQSFAAFEDVAKIITEGRGVGGNLNYGERRT